MSAVALIRFLGRREDPDYSAGVPEEDEADTVVEDAFGEIERRREACAGDYPFVLDDSGAIVQRQGGRTGGQADAMHAIYEYLLLATRLDMKNDRRHGGYDGTKLLEELAAEDGEELPRQPFGEYGVRHRCERGRFSRPGKRTVQSHGRRWWLRQSRQHRIKTTGRQVGRRCMDAIFRSAARPTDHVRSVQDGHTLQGSACSASTRCILPQVVANAASRYAHESVLPLRGAAPLRLAKQRG